ncbi:MAG: hypothetical protein WAZ97_03485, partial [Pseudolabrys sp.]
MYYVVDKQVLHLLSACRHAHAESGGGSAAMRWLWRADLGIKEIAYRTAQNLYSLHGSRQFTRAPKVRVTVSA